jgi:hypothetical protein
MIDLDALQTQIEAALSSELGTYTLENDETTPAIGRDYGAGQHPPPPSTAIGLECVLIFRPDIPLVPLLGGGYQETYSVQILLKQRDETRDCLTALGLLLDAIANLPETSLQSGSIRRVLPLAELGNIETLSLVVNQIFLRE